MKLFTGSLAAAGLILLVSGAQAQTPYDAGRYAPVSDFGGPYAAMPPGHHYGYGPSLLPQTEVYAVLRDNGFSPLGIPRLRGFVYTIGVIDRSGEDGRLVIDARDGRILRFVPGYRMGGVFHEGPRVDRPRVMYGAPPPEVRVPDVRSSAPPPGSAPKVASHSVPVPKPKPLAAREPAKSAAEPVKQAAAPPTTPTEVQQVKPADIQPAKPADVQAAAPPSKPAEVPAAAPQEKPAEAQAAAPPALTTGSAPAKPAPQIAPTQDLPTAQGLE